MIIGRHVSHYGSFIRKRTRIDVWDGIQSHSLFMSIRMLFCFVGRLVMMHRSYHNKKRQQGRKRREGIGTEVGMERKSR